MRGRILWVVLTSLLVTTAAWGDGRIEGQITNEAGKGLGGVTVVVSETGDVALTENNGRFEFGVPAGSYNLSLPSGVKHRLRLISTTSTLPSEVDPTNISITRT